MACQKVAAGGVIGSGQIAIPFWRMVSGGVKEEGMTGRRGRAADMSQTKAQERQK